LSDPHTTVIVAGGPPHVVTCRGPCAAWSADRPPIDADAGASLAAAVAAGARLVATDTMHLWPASGSGWEVEVDRAVAAARRHGVPVWGVVPPASLPRFTWLGATFEERVHLRSGWSLLAARFAAAGVDGLLVLGFTDAVECVAAVTEVRATSPAVPIAALLSPRDDGRLRDGSDPAEALRALRRAGAGSVGFGCGTGPASIAAAVALAPEAEWARPSAGDLSPEEVAAALIRLADSCHTVGGCCGVGPDVTALQRRAAQLVLRHAGDAADVTRRLVGDPTR
jgi:hypothetical protein